MKEKSRRLPPIHWLLGLMSVSAMLSASRCYDTQELKPDSKDGASCGPSYNYRCSKTASDFDGVDLLVVIDNSNSMTEEQEILSTGFFTLVNTLVRPLDDDPDWPYPPVDNLRVAVVTSDMGLQWGGGQTGGNEISVDHCDRNGTGDNGAFQPWSNDVTYVSLADGVLKCEPGGGQCPEEFECVDGFCASSTPGVQTVNCAPSLNPGAHWTETTAIDPNPDIPTQVACLAKQGTKGCGVEQPLEAAARGLETHPEFIVTTHVLAVLVVSDEEDCSIEDNGLFQTEEWLSGNRPTGYLNVACSWPEANEQFLFDPREYYSRFVALKDNLASAVVFAAIVGVPPGDSSPCQGNGRFIEQSGCLDDPAMQLEVQEFQQEHSDGSTSTYNHFHPACTRTDDVTGAEVTSARPGRRYVKTAQEFGINGFVYSICNEDWSPAMHTFSKLAARQIAPVCYPHQLAWTPLTQAKQEATECEGCGKSDCDLFIEIIKTGSDIDNDSCPAELYEGLTEKARDRLLQKKHITNVQERGGVVRSKTIHCPVPKLAAPLGCDDADSYIRDTQPKDAVGWFYCETSGENFNDACNDGEVDNDGDGKADCDDPECADCSVCGGTGADCSEGCRYNVEVTEHAKRIATGHYLTVQCDPVPNDDGC